MYSLQYCFSTTWRTAANTTNYCINISYGQKVNKWYQCN